MDKTTDRSPPQVEGWQAIVLVETLREAVSALHGAVYEMAKIAAGERSSPDELVQYYRGKADQVQDRLVLLETGEATVPASGKDWYCNECRQSNVVHEAEVQWNPKWGCMEVINIIGDRHCVECMQEQTFPEKRGEPVFGVKPVAANSAA